MSKKTQTLLALWVLAVGMAGAQCPVNTFGFSQVISNDTSLPAGTYNITGDFTLHSGDTLTITNYNACPFIINANNIYIYGVIIANGAGYTGGAGGYGGSSSGGPGGDSIAGGGGGGYAANGIGGGTAGNAGHPALSGCEIGCGDFICIGGNDAIRAGGGGGSGGSGASYGNIGGKGAAGAQGRLENVESDSKCGTLPSPGAGGSGNTAPAGYGNIANDTDLLPGSGGGGGGGGGGGYAAGSAGGYGGNGGGSVNLNASGNLVISGTVAANGSAGNAGGNGGVRAGDGASWNCSICSGGTGADDCRDASLCGVCTYYTYSWPGGAGGGAGGGSGGGIKLEATGIMNITGILQANGGNGGNAGRPWETLDGTCNNYASGGAPGSGGVIKYVYNPCAANVFSPVSATVSPGIPGTGTDGFTSTNTGSAGTLLNQNSNIYVPGSPPPVYQTDSVINATCVGVNNGAIFVHATGGSGAYKYSFNGSALQSSNVLNNISAGVYAVKVVDSSACISATALVTVGSVDSLSYQIQSLTEVSCYGKSDGSFTILVSGGIAPYTYSIDSGATQLSNSFAGLASGIYNIEFADNRGCIGNTEATITEPVILRTVIDSTVNLSCGVANSGMLFISATGGVVPYTYKWSNNDTIPDISGLAAGVYKVTLTDMNGCKDTLAASVGVDSVLSVNISTSNPLCYGGTGNATITLNNGTAPYDFRWSNGATTSFVSGLTVGTYYITVTDLNHCHGVDTAFIDSVPKLVASIDSILPVCYTATGAAEASVSGGTPPYTYLWSDNETASTITNLASGNYSITVYDMNNCSLTIGFSISSLSTLALSATQIPDSCFGGDDGQAIANATGGVPPYSFLWNNNDTSSVLAAVPTGQYIVTLTDNAGCVVIDTVFVSQPSPLHAVTSITNATFGQNNGTATVDTVTGGVGPYLVVWSDGQNTRSAVNLATGTYTFTVTDNNHCTYTDSVVVSQTTGIANISGNIQSSIYPNPARNEFTVDILNYQQGITLSIFDVVGDKILFKELGTAHTMLDVSKLAAGIFTIELRRGNNLVIQQLVIQR